MAGDKGAGEQETSLAGWILGRSAANGRPFWHVLTGPKSLPSAAPYFPPGQCLCGRGRQDWLYWVHFGAKYFNIGLVLWLSILGGLSLFTVVCVLAEPRKWIYSGALPPLWGLFAA